jgi:hypothetical protein
MTIEGQLTTSTGPGGQTLFLLQGGIYQFRSSNVRNLRGPAVLSTFDAQIKFITNALSVTLPTNQSAFVLESSSMVSISECTVAATGTTGNPPSVGVIECEGQNIIVDVGVFTYDVNNIYGIHLTQNSSAHVKLSSITSSLSVDSTLLMSEGSCHLTADEMNATNGCHFLQVGPGGQVSMNVESIRVQGPGNGILLVAGALGLDGYVSTMRVNENDELHSQYVLNNASTSNVYLSFESIFCGGAQPEPLGGRVLIDCNGGVWLSGQDLELNFADTCIRAASGVVTLDIHEMRTANANYVLHAQDNAIVHATIDNVQAAAARIGFLVEANALLELFGESYVIIDPGGNIASIAVTDNATLNAVVNFVNSFNSVLDIATSSVVTYKTTQTFVQNLIEAVNITSPQTAIITLGGYFSTPHPTAIAIQSPNPPRIRLLSSTLVATVFSISSGNPVTVSVEPSSANMPVNGAVTVVPTGALFVNPAVF